MPGTPVDLRTELATATRILAQHELIGMFGHVSVLTDDPQRYLVCPGAGARKDRCRSTDVLELDLDHEFDTHWDWAGSFVSVPLDARGQV